jgi:TatA/E family protein of Tat protein translocase
VQATPNWRLKFAVTSQIWEKSTARKTFAVATRFEATPIQLDNPEGVPYYRSGEEKLFSGEFAQIGFLLFIAFLLFGPKKLPEIARTLGKGLGELRRASNELKSSLEEEIRNLDRYPEDVSEPAPKYGRDYPEPAAEETETRT